jgi:hypothetical protein
MMSYMTTRPNSRLLGVAATLVMILGCTSVKSGLGTIDPGVLAFGSGGTHIVQRVAKGCAACRVTVAVTAIPGPLPDLTAPPPSPIVVAYLANVGEGGRNEKRYDLKPSTDAGYELELSADGSRIRWSIVERLVGSATRLRHRTGHLAVCDSTDHSSPWRDIDFKDCAIPNTYDPAETGSLNAKVLQLAFASSTNDPLGQQSFPLGFASRWVDALVSKPPYDAPGWISCTSGCCTLAL